MENYEICKNSQNWIAAKQAYRQMECEEKINFLLDIGIKFVAENGPQHINSLPIIHRELAAGATMHRGVYCPSPILDIVVGNIHRGKLLKHPTKRSKITHSYAFNPEGHLLYVETVNGTKIACTEYLSYCGNRIYGITIDRYGISAVSEEEYDSNNRIISYAWAGFVSQDSKSVCFDARIENYTYNDWGIDTFNLALVTPSAQAALSSKYCFIREHGIAVAYESLNDQNKCINRYRVPEACQHRVSNSISN